jgi:transcriptional repressor NrdR
MRCPHCGHDEDRVLDTRPVRDGAAIRRRRECMSCQHRFTTYEYIEAGTFSVVKKDGRREAFRREKLIAGLSTACEKRPVPQSVVEEVAERIETDLARTGRSEVKSADIGARVMEELRALDPVAYLRFASVYLNFSDLREFQETIRHYHETQAATGEAGPVPDPGTDTDTDTGSDSGPTEAAPDRDPSA